MGKGEQVVDLSSIAGVYFKSYQKGESYPISNVTKIIELEKNYLIYAHNIETSFAKDNIVLEKITDAS